MMALRFNTTIATLFAVGLLGFCPVARCTYATDSRVVDVRSHGAVGDGTTHDTTSINEAISACAAVGGGQVVFSPGRYLSGTIHLRSNVSLVFQIGATLAGTSDLGQYQHFRPPEGTHEARFRPQWHRGLIFGVGVENVAIVGHGVVDGAKVFDPKGEERMRGPHTILLGDCRNVSIRDITIIDSANYAVMLEHCHDVDIRNIKVTGGWDAVHFRGWAGRPCENIKIIDCQFFTGDDCIAGRYWKNVLIQDCVINSSCNGIRVIGPAEHLIVHDCLFYGPGQHKHRTSDRRNMLAGIILQPGAWDSTEGRLDRVVISDNTMRDVATPLQVSLKPGNTAGEIIVDRLSATGVYRAACSVESWAEEPIERFVLRDASIEYAGGGKLSAATSAVSKPGLDARRLPVWGFFARNVRSVVLEDIRFHATNPDMRHVLRFDSITDLTLDNLKYPMVDGGEEAILLNDVIRSTSRRLVDD